jgi:uroporphyrinogen decarboxylase
MKPRKRVLAALDHKEPDRIPIDLGSTVITSIHKKAYTDLMAYLDLPGQEIHLCDVVQQVACVDETLLEQFNVDLRMIHLPPAIAPVVNYFEEAGYYAFIDRWGSKLYMPTEDGLYFDWVDFPIKEPTMEALDNYIWPMPDLPEINMRLGEQAKYLYENTDYALAGSAIFGGGIFEQGSRVMGMENFLKSLITEPAFADRLMDTITDIYIESCNNYLDQVGKYLDVFAYGDDVNSQSNWMISPEIYKKMIKPKWRRLAEAVKKKTDAKLFFHGCGAVYDLIPHLIDIGFDIVNPVQVSAKGMDTKRLKAAYGNDIAFWGGGVDTQWVLPFGSTDEVRDEVKKRIDDLGPGGGFVFAAVHNIQAYVPPENIVAAFETALAYG